MAVPEYVDYYRQPVGFLSLDGTEDDLSRFIEFQMIPYGVIEAVPIGDASNLIYGFALSDNSRTTLEYNSEVFSSNLVTTIKWINEIHKESE